MLALASIRLQLPHLISFNICKAFSLLVTLAPHSRVWEALAGLQLRLLAGDWPRCCRTWSRSPLLVKYPLSQIDAGVSASTPAHL